MYKEASPKTIFLKEYQVSNYLIDQVELRFELHESGTKVYSELHLRRNPEDTNGITALRLDGEGLRTLSIGIDGKDLSEDAYEISEDALIIPRVPEQFVFNAVVEIAPEDNTSLEGLYRSSGMYCSQCEAEGFRHITWYLDRPDVMARFKVRVEADKANYPILLSNGNPGTAGDLANGRHFAEWNDPFPKPCYLFALVAGDLQYIEDHQQIPGGKNIQLRIYVEPENISKCDHAMRSLKRAMTWDEEKYGRVYDLDVYNIVAVNDFNMGAMENKGLNVFNSKYVLASPDTATDADYQGIEAVIAHEYFHNWTGNRITCRDWFQLSLKEGLTVYRDQEFSADMGSRGVKRIEDVRLLRANQFAEDAGPMAHPVRPASYIEINNFYTLTVYEKGAEIVRMQANLLGAETYRAATDLYFDRFDGKAVTTEDFVQCMADAGNRDMTQFRHWYDYAGTPRIDATGHYDEESGNFTLSMKQSVPDTPGQTEKPAFHIPVVIGLLDKNGDDITEQVLELTEQQSEFVFEKLSEKPVPSLLRGLSAPVELHYDYSDEELIFLMSADSDGFNRWNAAQTLAERVLLDMIAQHKAGQTLEIPDAFLSAFRDSLRSDHDDPGLIADVLQLPAEAYLGDRMVEVDVDGIHQARQALRKGLGKVLTTDLISCYEQYHDVAAYTPSPDDIGRRRLKNLTLSYLAASGGDEAEELLLNQYGAGHNMTDVMAALALIANSELAQRQDVLDDFDQQWRHDPLVMDKWFSVQAIAARGDLVSELQQLLQHRAFSIRNPNKIRALIGSFAGANQMGFHRADGSGYRFVSDRILEIDPLNPQVASRLLRTFSRWRHFDESRQGLMQTELQRILAVPNLSRDAYEIASKSLQ